MKDYTDALLEDYQNEYENTVLTIGNKFEIFTNRSTEECDINKGSAELIFDEIYNKEIGDEEHQVFCSLIADFNPYDFNTNIGYGEPTYVPYGSTYVEYDDGFECDINFNDAIKYNIVYRESLEDNPYYQDITRDQAKEYLQASDSELAEIEKRIIDYGKKIIEDKITDALIEDHGNWCK